ncbi:NUDIX hydrolase [Thermanaerovibrio acidaminovorans]|uniref:NUDIX hydrolase n=1 Tax=Thermanaerovibrio acidaminovorans TaxID=81462 RepID=UPI002491A489|nr:NUDIX domain-containing protein [Thermanaerovibrio acidaminovorans]
MPPFFAFLCGGPGGGLDECRDHPSWSDYPADRLWGAVWVPLWVGDGGFMTLLMRRSTSLRRHPGQISFPGGARDPLDPGPVDTAMREAMEEVSPGGRWEPLGLMRPQRALSSGFSVVPVVFVSPDRAPYFSPSSPEVDILSPVKVPPKGEFAPRPDGEFQLPVPPLGTVWGMTARVLMDLAKLVGELSWPF